MTAANARGAVTTRAPSKRVPAKDGGKSEQTNSTSHSGRLYIHSGKLMTTFGTYQTGRGIVHCAVDFAAAGLHDSAA